MGRLQQPQGVVLVRSFPVCFAIRRCFCFRCSSLRLYNEETLIGVMVTVYYPLFVHTQLRNMGLPILLCCFVRRDSVVDPFLCFSPRSESGVRSLSSFLVGLCALRPLIV